MTKHVSKKSKFYRNLLTHCKKQYRNVAEIHTAYVVDGQVANIDYTDTAGGNNIASLTAYADYSIQFTN